MASPATNGQAVKPDATAESVPASEMVNSSPDGVEDSSDQKTMDGSSAKQNTEEVSSKDNVVEPEDASITEPTAETFKIDKQEDEGSKQKTENMGAAEQRIKIQDKVHDPNDPYIAFPKAKPEFKKNIKSDPTILEASEDPVEIRKQVEFYFSDSNLPTDWHLVKKVGFSQNRPVPIADIHSFSRMRRFRPFEAIVAALKDSEFLEVIEDDKIRRKVPLPSDVWQGTMKDSQKFFEDKTLDRSIYAKGFGEEQPTTQFDIEAFFTGYGHTSAVRLRRAPNKFFKGSVFVEFADEETQKKFMALDVKPKWKETELLWKSKRDYVQEKAADYAARKKGRPDANDWKARRDHDQRNGHRNRGGYNRGGGRNRGNRDRGSRGGRSGRDRDFQGESYHEHDPKVPEIRTSKPTDPDAPEMSGARNTPPTKTESPENKKRAREGDDNVEGDTKPAKVVKTEG